MRRCLAMTALVFCVSGAAPADATVGGEWLCDVLGYEAATGRVYVHQLDGSDADGFGYETQVPVLVRPDERADSHVRVVEWRLATD